MNNMRPMIQFIQEHYFNDLVGCEVGVWYGDNALNMLQNLHIKKLYLVDPYRRHRIYNGRLFTRQKMDIIKTLCNDKLKGYKDVISFIRMKSVAGSYYVPDDSLDFCYIDGQHKYSFVKEDLKYWYPKIKHGGVFGGHDYELDAVKEAVDNFFDKDKLFTEEHESHIDWWLRNE